MDVHYTDLMADPMKEIRRIYDFIDFELEEETLGKMDGFRLANPKDKRGAHRYRPEIFGLDRNQLDRDFAAYRDCYEINQEGE